MAKASTAQPAGNVQLTRRLALITFTGMLTACGSQQPAATEPNPPSGGLKAVTPAPAPPAPTQIQLDITETLRLVNRVQTLYTPTPTSDLQAVRIECEAIRQYITALQPRYLRPDTTPLAQYKAALALRDALPSAASAAERMPIAVTTLSTPNTAQRTLLSTRSLAHIPLSEALHYLNEAQKALTP